MKMKMVSQVICISHLFSVGFSIYLGSYSIQQPIEMHTSIFQLSIIDSFILSLLLFLFLLMGSIFGSAASYFSFQFFPVFSLILGLMGLSVFLFFDVPTSNFQILASLNSLLQIFLSIWLLYRHLSVVEAEE
ncbi:hypothetical protein D920_02877 [Enterococcus faecalis 13-SD-W-01]|jgi:hypothetical protein|nr:hypothetical protein D920_02877 [Enterococcus faecalis 13-SD-W-01]